MNTVKLFVEGGGSSKSLHTECRMAFSSFLKKAGFVGHMPRIVACGSRNEAYSDYCTAINNGETAVLLVDSEAPVIIPPGTTEEYESWKPWHHLKNRRSPNGQMTDNWDKPQGGSEIDCHLMVESMESWFLADPEALKTYYGKDFCDNALPKNPNIEELAKEKVLESLKHATNHTQKGVYDKGRHSFELLGCISQKKVTHQSQWANRFVVLLSSKLKPS